MTTEETNYKPVASDGAKDGGDGNNWIGNWFVPVTGVEYMIPENAGNYASARGMHGRCTDVRVNGFGHAWALIAFGGKGRGRQKRRWIRTCYLVASEKGKPIDRELEPVKPDVVDATDPVKEKFAAVWTSDWAPKTGEIKGY